MSTSTDSPSAYSVNALSRQPSMSPKLCFPSKRSDSGLPALLSTEKEKWMSHLLPCIRRRQVCFSPPIVTFKGDKLTSLCEFRLIMMGM